MPDAIPRISHWVKKKKNLRYREILSTSSFLPITFFTPLLSFSSPQVFKAISSLSHLDLATSSFFTNILLPSEESASLRLAKVTESITGELSHRRAGQTPEAHPSLSFWKHLSYLHPSRKQLWAANISWHCSSRTHGTHVPHHSFLRDQREWDCSICLSEHLLFSTDSCLTADF